MERDRPSAETLLAELGFQPRLTIYIASAPGAGKTHRLLSDANFQRRAGRRVAVGWVETKGRPDLDELLRDLSRIPPRRFASSGGVLEDFDLEAALASDHETIVLDELAHANPDGAPHAKRWQDALALRRAGKSVLGAFNVQHLETVAPTAERIIGHPVRELVPLSFLKSSDSVIALDVSSAVLESRLHSGRIVAGEDVEQAAFGVFRRSNLDMLRELLLRTVDQLTVPVVSPAQVSTALAIVSGITDARAYLRRVGALAEALDLAVEISVVDTADPRDVEEAARAAADGAAVIALPERLDAGHLEHVRAAFVAVPSGEFARRILGNPVDRTVFVADPTRPSAPGVADVARHPYGQSAGDRMRIGYGKLTIYLGSAAGCGKTYAMLDGAHDLQQEGVDVVAALVETHGRVDTTARLVGLEVLARLPNGELDRAAILRRRPAVALIDELAHTNEPGSEFRKRFDDVIAVLRRGISVLTTLNVQHLQGLGEAVERLTGTRVRETLPDAILQLADDVIFVDVTPEVLRERLREGKVYPLSRVDAALSNFFRTENLAALRELAVRELMHARRERRHAPPFARVVLGVVARERDLHLIERMSQLTMRFSIELLVVHVKAPGVTLTPAFKAKLDEAVAKAQAHLQIVESRDVAAALVGVARELDVIAVESPRGRHRLFGPPSFAIRLLRAGCREMLVLAPRTE